MTKKEIVWREILFQATTNKITEFTQKGLANKFGFSLSTIFNALKIARQSNAIKVTGRNFTIQDAEKFLYIWATQRNTEKEISYQTRVNKNIREIERLMPPSAIFACYSACAMKYGASSDYDKVYVYADDEALAKIKKRFPPHVGYANLIVLKSDPLLKEFGETNPDVQTFVDLWNMKDWYAKEFLNKLKEKMFRQ